MKRAVLLILVLMLLVDLTDGGCIGKAKFCLPQPAESTSVASCQDLSDSGQSDVWLEPASSDEWGNPFHGYARSAILFIPPALKTIHRCYLSSAGGLPL